MRGTIRAFDEAMRDDIHERVTTLAEAVARGSRAGCTVCIDKNYPVTVNDPELTAVMVPTLERVAGADKVLLVPKVTGSEDFSYFQRLVPGLFYFVGVTADGIGPGRAPSNHSPHFAVDERGLAVGLRTLTHLACDYLDSNA